MMTKILMLSAALVIVAGAAYAAEPDDAIQYRENIMHAMGGHATGVALAIQGKIDDPRALKAHAEMLARTASLALQAFKQNTDGKGKKDTEAKSDIWAKWPEFEKDMKALEVQAQKLVVAVNSGGAAAARSELPALSKTCKTCHDTFRKKD